MKISSALALGIFLVAMTGAALEKQVPDYPAFIFGHIVWEDESTAQSLRELIQGYQDRQIPISGVIIDSPWETAYNTFEFDSKRFPEYRKLIAEIKSRELALILWITSAVNTDDPGYQYALEKGYFAPGLERYKWWKGTGGLIDYQNPEAVKWWHGRMDKALELGVDGWKVDGVEGMVALKGIKKQRDYSAAYYSDFFNYSRERTGRPVVVMARGIEKFDEHSLSLPRRVNPLGLGINIVFAPRPISFMTWMGDKDPTWTGLRDTWVDFENSVKAGYAVPGFDIYGYREGKRDKEVFVRWAQWGAFAPLMENGGPPDHPPWVFGEDVVEIYRKLAVWHEEMGWYFYSLLPERFAEGKSLVRILPKSYLLGDSIFVAPVMGPGGKVSAKLPKGNWRYWYNLSRCYNEKASIPRQYPLEEFPVYVAEGSLIPLRVKSQFAGHQLNSSFAGQDTFWLLPGNGAGQRDLYYVDHGRGKVTWKREGAKIEVSAQGLEREVVLLVEGISGEPAKIGKAAGEAEKSTLEMMVSLIKSIVEGGKGIDKADCSRIKPGPGAEYCVRQDQLFVELIPVNGKAELEISF